MTTLYKDKHHIVVLTVRNDVFIVWARTSNDTVSAKGAIKSWEIIIKAVKTPLGLYRVGHKNSLMKVKNLFSLVKRELKLTIECFRDADNFNLPKSKWISYENSVKIIVEETIKELAQTNLITEGAKHT